jgi:F-type H+-transporting ATPase subunit b
LLGGWREHQRYFNRPGNLVPRLHLDHDEVCLAADEAGNGPAAKTNRRRLAAAERGKHELEQSSKRAADALKEARAQAQEIIAQAEKRAAQLVEEAKVSARTEGERIVAGAKAEIDQEVFRARETLRVRVAELAVEGAEKILRREVDAKAHADLLNAVAEEL